MIDRRTFLKLSAGALVLTAAGALTGCGGTVIDKTSGVAKIGDVTFICATPFLGGGDNFALTYCTEFTIQNNSSETVKIAPEDITCIFREADTEETLNWSQRRVRRLSTMVRRDSIWKLRSASRKRTVPAPMNCVCATMAKPLYSSMETTAKT